MSLNATEFVVAAALAEKPTKQVDLSTQACEKVDVFQWTPSLKDVFVKKLSY